MRKPAEIMEDWSKGASLYFKREDCAHPNFVQYILEAHDEGIEKDSTWFTRLSPFFDKKFDPKWRTKMKNSERTLARPTRIVSPKKG